MPTKKFINYILNRNQNIIVRIDDNAIEKVMVWAFGDGEETDEAETIAYWCDKVTVAGGKNAAYHKDGAEYFDLYTHLQRGGEMVLHDAIYDAEYTLTRESLFGGIRQALYEYYYHLFNENITELIRTGLLKYRDGFYRLDLPKENWNMFGDYAIQYAIFHDLYYTHHSVRAIGKIRVHIPRFKK